MFRAGLVDDQNDDEPAFAAVRASCRANAGRFYLASMVLPRAKRDAVCAVHGFLVLLQETLVVADRRSTHELSCCSLDSIDQRAEMLHDMLGDLYAGQIALPPPDRRGVRQHLLRALQLTVQSYEIPHSCLARLIDGRRADVRTARYATWSALERHCDQTGGAVARVMACICGMTHSDGAARAAQLGVAMRLTGVLRDLRDDFRLHGTLYLPLEDLARFGYSERDLTEGRINDRFRELIHFQVQRARSMFDEACAGIGWLADEPSRVWAGIIAGAHVAVLDAIVSRNYDVLTKRPAPGTGRMLRALPAIWRLARGCAPKFRSRK